MPGFAIRFFEPHDADACTRILDAAWHAGHPHIPRVIDRATFDRETRGEWLFVADAGAAGLLGFVALHPSQAFVHHLYVDPASHRHGVGSALLGHAVAAAGGRASLKCLVANAGALTFYRRLGWTAGETGAGDFGAWIRLISPPSAAARRTEGLPSRGLRDHPLR